MMRRTVRRRAMWALAAMLPALHACYEYVPLATTTPPADQLVDLQITDAGRTVLNDRFGQGVVDIVGRVVSQQGNELTVNVYSVTQLNGETTQWTGETVHLDRANIGMIKGRQFSASRTALVAIGGAAAVALVIANRGLLGSFSGPTTDQPSTDPTPAKVVIPRVP
jgi:hypothetical protein